MPRKKNTQQEAERNIALCYIRQSFTRDDDDMDSPERQRENVAALCEQQGWIPEWYEDVGGHRSGRKVNNRPQWLALERRLQDSEVIAVVANDLSRLHRKGWRVGDLLEQLQERKVLLGIAARKEVIDPSSLQVRSFMQLRAFFDEFYAEDVAQKATDSARHRKAHGKTIGLPPYGTTRNDEGYLIPTPEGAWLMPNGRFKAGTADDPPHPDAIWRSYYECAEYMLTLYAQGNMGLDKIAYQLNEEGWPFRTRRKKPRSITRDDVRRVLANWPEYGGIVQDKKAKDRPAYEYINADEIVFYPERAVFPLELLRQVARVRQERTMRPADHGAGVKARHYPLSVITYCAHCERLALAQNNPKLRTTLTGRTNANGTRRYVHRSGVSCGCTNRSVPAEVLEHEFGRLVKLLTVNEDALHLMTELSLRAEHGNAEDAADLERQKQEAIALARRRIDSAVDLYAQGYWDKARFESHVKAAEQEIVHWEMRTAETEEAALELAGCMQAVERVARLWDISDDEDKQGLARNLFEYLVFDLDTRRLVFFQLKPWADRFLVLRSALYDDDGGGSGAKKNPRQDTLGMGNDMPHRGLWNRGFHQPRNAMGYGIRLVYCGIPLPASPVSDATAQPLERNMRIRAAYANGTAVPDLAQQYQISWQRVYQILNEN